MISGCFASSSRRIAINLLIGLSVSFGIATLTRWKYTAISDSSPIGVAPAIPLETLPAFLIPISGAVTVLLISLILHFMNSRSEGGDGG